MILRKTDTIPFLVPDSATIEDALGKIDDNDKRICFVTDDSGVLQGALSDGDIRRYLLEGGNLDDNVDEAMNPDCLALPDEATRPEIQEHFDEEIGVVPLVDEGGHVARIAFEGPPEFEIGGRSVGKDHPCYVIAEIGINHNGRMDLARDLIDRSAEANVDAVKFQLRNLEEVYRERSLGDDAESLSTEYTLDLLEKVHLDSEQMAELADYARARDLQFLCSAWDPESVDRLEEIGVPAYKIASADFTNLDLVRYVAEKGHPLITSTGMTTEEEIRRVVAELEQLGADFALLHCNSTYPAPAKDIHLRYIDRLAEFDVPVGYSGHERGIAISLAAVAQGASILERHVTLDRSMEGPDHKASLLPGELADLVEGVREVEVALGDPSQTKELSQGEIANRENLGKSLVAATEIEEGETIREELVDVKSPGKGLSPLRKPDLLGRDAPRALQSGDFFHESDLDERTVEPGDYDFDRPWGVVARYHDLARMAKTCRPDLVEFHFSYADLDKDPADAIEHSYDCGLAVHVPELFPGDHLLDLCSSDEEYRQQSIEHLQSVIDLSREMTPYFDVDEPLVVVHVGGVTDDEPLGSDQRSEYYDRLVESLDQIDETGVRLLPENMPPFPWLFGGQRFQNLLVRPGEVVEFAERTGYDLCIDLSHAKLACNHLDSSYADFLEQVSPYARHLHISDARGTDGEGLQVGDGEIDFANAADILDERCPDASLIPEIWQGHKDDGRGFWIALEQLQRWF